MRMSLYDFEEIRREIGAELNALLEIDAAEQIIRVTVQKWNAFVVDSRMQLVVRGYAEGYFRDLYSDTLAQFSINQVIPHRLHLDLRTDLELKIIQSGSILVKTDYKAHVSGKLLKMLEGKAGLWFAGRDFYNNKTAKEVRDIHRILTAKGPTELNIQRDYP